MSTVLSIVRRELQSYFVSPIAYTVMVIFLLIAGWGFTFSTGRYAALAESRLVEARANLQNFVIRDLTYSVNVGMLLAIPALSMRLLTEERKTGTAELLMTSPITTAQLVLGKFLGTMTILALMLFLTTPCIGVLVWKGEPELAAIGSAYLGYVLYGGVILAIGLFSSALTKNQIVAVLLTYAIFLPLYMIERPIALLGAPWDDILVNLSLIYGLMDVHARGLVSTHYLVLDGALIFIFLFLCVQVIDSSRWR